jgi:hypothetical protein
VAKTRQASSHSKAAAGRNSRSQHKHKGHHKSHHPAKHHPAKHHKHKRHKKRKHRHVRRPRGLGTLGTPSPTYPSSPPPPSNTPVSASMAPVSLAGAHRLLWRAGFGPTRGQAEALVGQPLQQVVFGLTRPSGEANLSGPAPVNDAGEALAPADAWGEDHCWWLDRMIRSDQQLVERMTFIWHDWFANSNSQVNSQRQMLDQNNLFRRMGLGSFQDLFLAVTTDPAMLIFLNGTSNSKQDPNENYAREMMELFSLGADRGAYTEDDVREMARALTGWRSDWSAELGNHNFRFDPSYHDTKTKSVFDQKGNWDYNDAVRLCVNHPLHPSFFVIKLWSYFIPTPPDTQTLASLQGLYTSSGFSIRAVVEAILQHPDLYNGPELVTPPVVFNAGLMRASGRYVDTTSWAWLCNGAGQQLFYPPNVAGWDFTRWLDTSTAKARWEIANYVTQKSYANPWGGSSYDSTEDANTAMNSALAYWGDPLLSADSRQCIADFAYSCLAGYTAPWQQEPFRAIRQNALRMLIATSPDLQVS